MTEAEWLDSSDPTAMLRSLGDRPSDRQYRLFAVACARDELARALAGQGCFNFGEKLDARRAELFWHPQEGYEAAVLAAEHGADGGTWRYSSLWFLGWGSEPWAVAGAAVGHDPDALFAVPPERLADVVRRYTNNPADYLRDIFGNPFRPSAIDSAWLTPDVTSLANAAYEQRCLPSGGLDTDRLAVLADALEEAGCTDGEMLAHLRSPGPHVRGCWAVDLVLGKG
jgi:hypothetical protein